jgi:uncharacterized protein (TIGR03118 family)
MLVTHAPTEHPVHWRVTAIAIAGLLMLAAATPVAARNSNAENTYVVNNLVSDVPGLAAITDPLLANPWGITASSTSPWWVANNHTDSSTLYTGAGAKRPLEVGVAGGPTGTVFNFAGAGNFEIASGFQALFLFANEDGQVLGWNPGVDPDTAIVAYTEEGASYKGLAIASDATGWHLYAADFLNGKVDVIGSDFEDEELAGDFTDPSLPAGYSPFGIQTLNGMIFVAYAIADDEGEEVVGEGLGVVDAFNTDGTFIGRVATGGDLNAPWGLAWAPAEGFGRFSGNLLVGNFGDGKINAYAWTPDGWEHRGHLKDTDHHAISIEGLWGIGFGNGGGSGAPNVLYFAAGIDDEEHGLFGSISVP